MGEGVCFVLIARDVFVARASTSGMEQCTMPNFSYRSGSRILKSSKLKLVKIHFGYLTICSNHYLDDQFSNECVPPGICWLEEKEI